jgi:hypothetical protein
MQIMLWGGQDYVRYFNEQEIIPGVPIELLWRDTALQTGLGIGHYERLVAAGVPLVAAVDSVLILGLRERFERDEVVMFATAGYHELMYPAFVGIDHPWGYEPRYAIGYARDLGFEVLPHEIIPLVVLDATVQLLRLREAGADLVYLQCPASGSGPILRDAERLGLLGEFQFAGQYTAMGEKVIESTGAASEGFLTSRTYPWFSETEVPGVKLMIDNMMKYHGEVQREAEYALGLVGAAVMCEAISTAIENVGYENLDGPAIKEALDGMKDFDVYGLASITYKPDDHRGATKMAVYEVRGGELVRVSDWREVPSGRDWEFE